MWGCGAGSLVTRMRTEGSQHPAATLSYWRAPHPTGALGRSGKEQPRLSNSYASLFPRLFCPTHLMRDALSAVVDNLLETFGEFHLYQ